MSCLVDKTPIDRSVVDSSIAKLGIDNIGAASIRELVQLVTLIEGETGEQYVRMEMGVPGLPPSKVGVDAEIAALERGVAAAYPRIDGIQPLKDETSKFIKNFMDIDIAPQGCIPTVGSMQGGYALFMTIAACSPEKDTALFIDPGFPVQKQQMMVMGQKYESFDIYKYRGDKLKTKLEEYLSKGNINSIIYSNPNNPSWICLTEEELKIIGELATEHDVIVAEDLAYFGMDFRKDLSKPGEAPYQASVAKYTDNYVLMISSSKIFSYAGQRIGVLAISDKLYGRQYSGLESRFQIKGFGNAIIFRALYSLSSGTSHSAQYAFAAMLEAVNKGEYNFVGDIQEYGERAKLLKEIFLSNGFTLVYDRDMDRELADGFYFTIAYPGMKGGELLSELLYYGVSAISLDTTGSCEEGLRACVSHVNRSQLPALKDRMVQFNKDHKIK